jgi:putative colanic acid biosynthesis acetyltransferase WcaF
MHKRSYQKLPLFELPPDFRGRPGWYVQLWWLVQSLLFKTSPQFMYGWRRWLLKAFGAKIGKGVKLRPSMHTQFPWKVSIGDHTWIGDEVVLYSLGDIEIGSNVVISQRSYLCTGSHDYQVESFPIYAQKITIEDECWLATDVYIAPNVTIGRGTVVGARSSVFHDLPPGIVAVGTPAKQIRER